MNWPNLWDTKHLWTDKVRQAAEQLQEKVPDVNIQWSVQAFFCHFGMGAMLAWLLAIAFIKRPAATPYQKTEFRIQNTYRWLRSKIRNTTAIWIGFAGGVMSWLPDLDHLSIPMFHHPSGRIAHPIAFTISIILATYCAVWIRKLRAVRADDDIVEAYVFFLIMSICVIAHVVEDFTLSWW